MPWWYYILNACAAVVGVKLYDKWRERRTMPYSFRCTRENCTFRMRGTSPTIVAETVEIHMQMHEGVIDAQG